MAGDDKNNVVEKKYIHVRINISGSPLECPGLFLLTACLLQFPIKDPHANFSLIMM
jgi:hypothetical protein